MGNRGGNPHHASKSKIFCRVCAPDEPRNSPIVFISWQSCQWGHFRPGNLKECLAFILLGLGVRRKWLVKNGDAVEETEESVEPDRDDSVGYDS